MITASIFRHGTGNSSHASEHRCWKDLELRVRPPSDLRRQRVKAHGQVAHVQRREVQQADLVLVRVRGLQRREQYLCCGEPRPPAGLPSPENRTVRAS